MSEEIIETSVTHEKHILEGSATDVHHRNSSIVSLPNGGSSRRNSTTKSDSPQNIAPNYLRASTGSCHNFCKYGKNNTFEEKPWKKKPVRKGTATSSPNNSLDLIQIKIAGETKKEKVASLSLEAKTCSPKENALSREKSHILRNSSSHVKKTPSSEPLEVIKRVITSPSQEMEVLDKSRSSTGGKGSKTEEKMDHSSEKRAPAKSKLNKVKLLSSSVDSDGKNGKAEIEGVEGSKTDEITDHNSEKHAPAKSKLTKVKPLSCSVDSDGKNRKEIKGRVKSEKKIPVPKASAKKALSPIASTSSSKIRHTRTLSFEGKKASSLKLASLMNDQNKTRMAGAKMSKNEKVAEKTLRVIKVETGSWTKSSSRIKDVESKENNKKTPRNRVVPSKDKYRSPVKLQFRSGKVVEIRSDNNTPRKLKFRTTRAPGGEEGKGEVTKKSLSKTVANTDMASADILSRKVVLKRQVVQGKKVARVLLNNIIEETASKLVESRKSKVKALVGAFETVISLHEVKSSRTVKLGGE